MTRRIFPVADWAPAQEAMYGEPAMTNGYPFYGHHEVAAVANEPKPRSSLSLSLPWRRPKSFIAAAADMEELSTRLHELAIHPSQSSGNPNHGYRAGSHQSYGSNSATKPESGSLRGMIRKASVSLKGMVHRRTLTAASSVPPDDGEESSTRPGTSHSTWQRLRQATGLRHSRSLYSNELKQEEDRAADANFPIPGIGGPPIIPRNTGAAAKAAAAAAAVVQSEYLGFTLGRPTLHQQALHNKWLAPASDDGGDRESGIGIAVANSECDADTSSESFSALAGIEDLVVPSGSSISRIDFISQLPIELAIQILSHLDARGLTTASAVSREWYRVASNQHIWRDSFLREKTVTYATSAPTKPGAGLGVPTVRPTNDWKQIYRVREELDRRWDAGKARPVYLNGHLDSIYCLQFDETKIITGSRDKTIRIWDMHTFECRLVIGPPEVINDISLLFDETGEPVHYATLHDNTRTALSVPATASFPTHHKASILCLQYDDRILVTGSSDASCIVYNVRSAYRPTMRLRHHTAAVLDLAFDEQHIVTCSKDVSICVWDRATGALLRQLRGHSGPVNAVQMRSNTIVSCSGDFRVKLWNIDTGKNIRELAGHTKGLACSQFSEDGRYIASAGNDKAIRVWDANTGECLREVRAHENLVRSLHIDSVSGRLVSGSYDTDIKVFDMETGRQLLDFPKWHASWVLSAKSDYRRIVSTGQDPKILIMDFGAEVRGIELLESCRREDGGYI